MAVANYESSEGHLPYRTTANRFHSWRSILIPFIQGQDFFDRIDLDAPWDSAEHAELRTTIPHGLQCHNREDGSGNTQIFAVIAPNSMWQEREMSYDDITDNRSQTLMFVELDLPGINWMSPFDITLDELLAMLNNQGRLPSPHSDFVLMAFADGRVRAIPHGMITPKLLNALVSIDGGEVIQDNFEE